VELKLIIQTKIILLTHKVNKEWSWSPDEGLWTFSSRFL